jgi:hypothetical protein
MHRQSSIASSAKRPAEDDINSLPKRFKHDSVSGRENFLLGLRATGDRMAAHVQIPGHVRLDGRELLRVFLLEKLEKKYPLTSCDCRHQQGHCPPSERPCKTAGTVDAHKAQAFVMSDFKKAFRKWLRDHKVTKDEVSDVEDSLFPDDEGWVNEDEELALMPPSSSFDPAQFPSSPVPTKRNSTKQRLMVLFYLLARAQSRDTFAEAFRSLCKSNLHLAHLCGCGLNLSTLRGACVLGEHLKLVEPLENREHVHYHFVLSNVTSNDRYFQCLASMKGGKYEDLF